tara:strand:- start:1051 stop:2073 length:1023 start_codon:yes stop_codon:yes gene_type:complete
MAYIGAEPQIGNYQICDAISVVNGQAAYTMQVSSTNVVPESANHMIVSLNGVIQKPGSSFTVSSSTITFASNLATGDSIDFIILLGNVLDLGVPSDSTVTTAKLGADAVTGAKIADDAIDSEHYTDGSIDTAHIADLQVTTAKIAADAITAAKLADDAISDEHLDPTAITGQTAETSVADDDLVLVSDTSASAALRKMTVSNLVANAGGGKINQVLHTDAQVNQNVSSDTELMSLAITPSASNSKVYMLFNGTAQMNANEYASFDFYRGSLSSGTKILDGGETLFNGQDNVRVGFSMSMLDSPNTTSQVTYTVVGVPLASGTIQFGATARNTLTLMEVLA